MIYRYPQAESRCAKSACGTACDFGAAATPWSSAAGRPSKRPPRPSAFPAKAMDMAIFMGKIGGKVKSDTTWNWNWESYGVISLKFQTKPYQQYSSILFFCPKLFKRLHTV